MVIPCGAAARNRSAGHFRSATLRLPRLGFAGAGSAALPCAISCMAQVLLRASSVIGHPDWLHFVR